MFDDNDYKNLLGIIEFAFTQGAAKNSTDARVMIGLQHKLQAAMSGEDIPVEEKDQSKDG